jgi:YVTN family beta-propeller protein
VAVDPAAHVAFVANAGGDSVSVINTRTNTVAATVHVRNSPHAVAVDPTSHTAYVANYGDGSVSIIKAP